MKTTLEVVLVGVGLSTNLAIRNLRRYALTDSRFSEPELSIRVLDFPQQDFDVGMPFGDDIWRLKPIFDLATADILEQRPSLVGFSCYMWNIDIVLRIAHRIKVLAPDTFILLGGPQASRTAAELLHERAWIDAIAIGDGEITFVDLLAEMVTGGRNLESVPGLATHHSGLDSVSPQQNPDLDRLIGVYEDLNWDRQSWKWPYLMYETQRGCPYTCSFCTCGRRSPLRKGTDLVVEEMVQLLKKGYSLEIVDPTFTTHRRRAKTILGGLAKHEYAGKIYLEAYPDSMLDTDLVELMAEARVAKVGVGLQTISEEGGAAINRKNDPEVVRLAHHKLVRQGLPHYFDLIYGLPETTPADFFESIDFLQDLGAVWEAYRLQGLPGAPMMELDGKELFFNQFQPYELLKSSTHTSRDLMACSITSRDCMDVGRRFGASHLNDAFADLGSLTTVVRALRSQHPDKPMRDHWRSVGIQEFLQRVYRRFRWLRPLLGRTIQRIARNELNRFSRAALNARVAAIKGTGGIDEIPSRFNLGFERLGDSGWWLARCRAESNQCHPTFLISDSEYRQWIDLVSNAIARDPSLLSRPVVGWPGIIDKLNEFRSRLDIGVKSASRQTKCFQTDVPESALLRLSDWIVVRVIDSQSILVCHSLRRSAMTLSRAMLPIMHALAENPHTAEELRVLLQESAAVDSVELLFSNLISGGVVVAEHS